jgi:hypothetical protein
MGTITINIKDNVEQDFRATVKKAYGVGKGKLGKAISEALESWVAEKNQERVTKRMLALMGKGFDLGGITYTHRSELHERK